MQEREVPRSWGQHRSKGGGRGWVGCKMKHPACPHLYKRPLQWSAVVAHHPRSPESPPVKPNSSPTSLPPRSKQVQSLLLGDLCAHSSASRAWSHKIPQNPFLRSPSASFVALFSEKCRITCLGV